MTTTHAHAHSQRVRLAGDAEVAIIGAGPIGLEVAVALKRAGIEYLHFDAKQIGYTISWFAPQTRFFSSNERIAIAGVPIQTASQDKSTREEYLAYLRGVVQQFDLQVNTYEPVVGIDRAADGADGFVLTTDSAAGRQAYRARRIVLATGGTDRPNRLGIPGEDLPHVSHYFDDPHKYFRKRLLVVGGKNSAVEAALRCHHAGARVALSYRRPALNAKSIKYWLLPEINGLLQSGRIEGHFLTQPTHITASHVRLGPSQCPVLAAATVRGATSDTTRGGVAAESVRGDDADSGRANDAVPDRAASNGDDAAPAPDDLPRDVRADFVLLLTGYEADMSLCRLAGVDLVGDERIPRHDPRTMETNVPGLYVAGTAVGGTQHHYKVFIENCHVHVDRILAAMTGAAPPAAPAALAQPES